MEAKSLGKIAVPTPGASVPLSPAPLLVWKYRVQALVGETGKVYLGDNTMTAGATNAGVIKQFWPTGAGGGKADEYDEIAPEEAGNVIDLSHRRLDTQIAGEGALVTYWQR
jgi:hypothetical protein